jgi:hypothetical protein
MENKKEKEKENMNGYYGHFTLFYTLHSQEKLFRQTFSQNRFSFTSESASPAQPQLKLPQPQLCQTHPICCN